MACLTNVIKTTIIIYILFKLYNFIYNVKTL